MSKFNCLRNGCKDVFRAYLVTFAHYAGVFEFPVIEPGNWIPNRLIPFSKALHTSDFDQWVHFFEDDCLFERIWQEPKRYLKRLKRFNGVILPDFSLYRDMPLVMQLWNIYRSRAVGCWLQANGVKVIANIRFGDFRTYHFCCDGISKGCTIAVGTHGTLKQKEDKRILVEGLDVIVNRLKPSAIVVYGAAPESIFERYAEAGIQIVQFDSEFAKAHRRAQ
ncbi:MAG: DUF4417 domain-containing protein [Coriobacteriales bacterium]|jgi:hypothetical protein